MEKCLFLFIIATLIIQLHAVGDAMREAVRVNAPCFSPTPIAGRCRASPPSTRPATWPYAHRQVDGPAGRQPAGTQGVARIRAGLRASLMRCCDALEHTLNDGRPAIVIVFTRGSNRPSWRPAPVRGLWPRKPRSEPEEAPNALVRPVRPLERCAWPRHRLSDLTGIRPPR